MTIEHHVVVLLTSPTVVYNIAYAFVSHASESNLTGNVRPLGQEPINAVTRINYVKLDYYDG